VDERRIGGEVSAAITTAVEPPFRRGTIGLWACGIILIVAAIGSLAIGPVAIAPGHVLSILFDAVLGVHPASTGTLRESIIVLDIRMPRMVLGVLVGASLGVTGALLQGVFRNPLADPIFVGVSPGAALAAVAFIVFGGVFAANSYALLARVELTLAAFFGALLITFLLHRLAMRDGRTSVATLLFTGIALGALAQAGTGLILFLASDQQLREFTFWSLGSLGGATWLKVAMMLPLALISFVVAATLAHGLDALALGEAEAFHLGINVERLKRFAVLAVAAGVGASVAVAGVIGFVGLVVPHLLRLMIGPAHKKLLIGSALLGAAILVAADVIARTLAAPAELPLGVVTAFLGAPFFLWLLRRYRASLGG
jgi:iron complex transport system permease protein